MIGGPRYYFTEEDDKSYSFLEPSLTNIEPPPSYQTGYSGRISTMGALLQSLGIGSGSDVHLLYAQEFGGVDFPVGIEIYNNNFEEKKLTLAYLDNWNSKETISVLMPDGTTTTLLGANRTEIKYTDMLSIIIEMLNQFIKIITIALISFTSLALVVSCVMIGIITYVSVVERTKEIGVIRSLGGRKRDVSYLFNAETFIIGLGSGLIGIAVTWLAAFIVNLIVTPNIGMVIAIFPIHYAAIMLALSIGLNMLSGLVPSMSAANKDPVVALRSE
jgi:putative ABC transport system permease protein